MVMTGVRNHPKFKMGDGGLKRSFVLAWQKRWFKLNLRLFFLCFILSLFLISSSLAVDIEGCYLYPESGDDFYCQEMLDSEAREDCENYEDCEIDNYFMSGSDCEDLSECEEIFCSQDCDYHSRGYCEFLGGEEIDESDESEYELWCSGGCCVAGDSCGYTDLRQDCITIAESQGLDPDTEMSMLLGYDANSCNIDVCEIELVSASIYGYVLDEENNAIEGASIELGSSYMGSSDSTGYYQILEVSPNSYLLKVSASGYASSSSSVTLSSGENEELDVVLTLSGESYTLSGTVVDLEGESVSSANICYNKVEDDGSSEDASSCTVSLSDGSYGISELESGSYTISVSKYGYTTTENSVVIEGADLSYDLLIEELDFKGIYGSTWLDENGDGSVSSDEGTAYGVSIYVDGVLKTSSNYPNGDYEVYLDEGSYEIFASYQDYASESYQIELSEGESYELDLLLEKEIGECSYGQENDQKSVEELTLATSQGVLAVSLSWVKPCAEVSGYIIEKNGETWQSLSPLAIEISDYDVEWAESYDYSIWAVYTDGPLDENGEPQVRLSTNSADASVVLGSSYCEGFAEGQQFCMVDDQSSSSDERKYVYSCDADNNILAVTDCSSLDDSESNWFCAEVGSSYAVCKNSGQCNVLSQDATPFGLQYTEDSCYGSYTDTGYENFCYYDYSNSITSSCNSCESISSCFDYLSEEACGIDNCLGQSCEWVDASSSNDEEFLDYGHLFPVSLELGKGYCVPATERSDFEEDFEGEYQEISSVYETVGDNYCQLCGEDASLFENNYCMPQVCSSLGECFSDEDASECLECGEEASSTANCYTYNSEMECSGGVSVSSSSGTIVGSEDQCTFSVCSWQAGDQGSSSDGIAGFFTDTGYCFKDGNADGIDDCSEFSSGEYSSCKIDVSSPVTSIDTENFEVVSNLHSNITFIGEDEANPMRELGFCLAAADAANCDDFEYHSYDGLENSESLIIDFIESSFLSGSVISGESYRLRYFSLDKYYNQESVKETFVFVDNEAPDFDLVVESSTIADVSEMVAYLSNMNEAVSCEFSLESVLPEGNTEVVLVARDEDKEASFSGLNGIIYNLAVNCIDDYGNEAEVVKEIVFDLEQDIDLIYPEYDGVVSETDIEFKIETAVSAYCSLFDTASGALLADFVSSDSENKVHETESLSGFYEGSYSGDLRVSCEELLEEDVFEDYFYFTVDFTGPETQIILSEGERVEKPTEYGWEEYFIESVDVSFECESEGFECNSIHYCLGEGCEYVTADGYVEISVGESEEETGESDEGSSTSITISESTKICYYASDVGGQYGYPDCGEILIEGYGIVLYNPELFYYDEEVWGVSNEAVFDWKLMTKVDTNLCTFDFNDGFDIYNQPEYKTIPEDTEVSGQDGNYYNYQNFPGDVLTEFDSDGDVKTLYVACEDYRGEVGPSQKMNLEYDPSAPEIESLEVDPDFVTEGVETTVFVETDDKTVCRFSDITSDENGEESGSRDFDLMEYSFSGFDENTLDFEHEERFGFSFSGAQKEYSLAVQCMNGAGDFSETKEVGFEVDYSVEGYISSLSPEGYLESDDVTLTVETSKNAVCEYDGVEFESTGGTSHSQYIGALNEGDYQYLIYCQIAEVGRDGEISFSIDLTAPEVNEVDDGSYSCSLDTVSVFIDIDDDELSEYYYELYAGNGEGSSSESGGESSSGESGLEASDGGSSDSSSSAGSSDSSSLGGEEIIISNTGSYGSLIASGSIPSEDSNGTNVISSLDLEENGSYYFSVWASDVAGNQGSIKSSDGFIAIGEESESCASDDEAPSVIVNYEESSCSKVSASIECEDELGCSSIMYGTSGSSESCTPDTYYLGGTIGFEESKWLCYEAEDVNGNLLSDYTQIVLNDDDGDGIFNSCDLCSETGAGLAVDAEGCGYGEVSDEEASSSGSSSDQDSDGLPNSWEQLFDASGCSLSYASSDSDGNGVTDDNEDYDGDGMRNYEEYRNGYNPCISDAPSTETGVDEEREDGTVDESERVKGEEESAVFAIVSFILGIILVMGAGGFLIYFYTTMPIGKKIIASQGKFAGKRMGAGVGARAGVGAKRGVNVGAGARSGASVDTGVRRPAAAAGAAGVGIGAGAKGVLSGFKQKLFGERKSVDKQKLSKGKLRRSLFDSFTQESSNFGHFEKIIKKRTGHLYRLSELGETYRDNRKDVRSGLRKEERPLFDRLDQISKESKNKPIHKVTNEDEAKDIFKKLKKLSKERKG